MGGCKPNPPDPGDPPDPFAPFALLDPPDPLEPGGAVFRVFLASLALDEGSFGSTERHGSVFLRYIRRAVSLRTSCLAKAFPSTGMEVMNSVARYLCPALLCLLALGAAGQAPVIESFTPASGQIGALVTINGANSLRTPAFKPWWEFVPAP